MFRLSKITRPILRYPLLLALTCISISLPFPSLSPAHAAAIELTSIDNTNYLRIFEAWNDINNPDVFSNYFVKTVERLPLEGTAKAALWSDSYWPSYQGGIAYRWNATESSDDDRLPFNRMPPTKEEVEKMSAEEMGTLSPAEKYDIYMGNFDYPTFAREKQRTSADAEKWEGICHGWSAATINFSEEPAAVVVKGPSGIKVPFGASDIKALLSYYQGEVGQAPATILGNRCEGGFLWHIGRFIFSRSCRDTNAGAFHIILTNVLGLAGKSFVADMTNGKEVWNFPIHSYSAQVKKIRNHRSFGSAGGTVKEIEYLTNVKYSVEAEASWEKTGALLNEANYHYRVELNDKGEIIGGEWMQTARPDFLWVQARPAFSGYYQNIEKIYQQSVR